MSLPLFTKWDDLVAMWDELTARAEKVEAALAVFELGTAGNAHKVRDAALEEAATAAEAWLKEPFCPEDTLGERIRALKAGGK